MRYFLSLRASNASVAINRQRILMILALYTVDCFGYRLAMTIGIERNVRVRIVRKSFAVVSRGYSPEAGLKREISSKAA